MNAPKSPSLLRKNPAVVDPYPQMPSSRAKISNFKGRRANNIILCKKYGEPTKTRYIFCDPVVSLHKQTRPNGISLRFLPFISESPGFR